MIELRFRIRIGPYVQCKGIDAGHLRLLHIIVVVLGSFSVVDDTDLASSLWSASAVDCLGDSPVSYHEMTEDQFLRRLSSAKRGSASMWSSKY